VSNGRTDTPGPRRTMTERSGFRVADANVIEVHAPPYEAEWGVHLFHQADLRAGRGA